MSIRRLIHRDSMLSTWSRMCSDLGKEVKLAVCDQMDKGGVVLL